MTRKLAIVFRRTLFELVTVEPSITNPRVTGHPTIYDECPRARRNPHRDNTLKFLIIQIIPHPPMLCCGPMAIEQNLIHMLVRVSQKRTYETGKRIIQLHISQLKKVKSNTYWPNRVTFR